MMDIKKGDKIKVVKAFTYCGVHFKKGQVGQVLVPASEAAFTRESCIEWRKPQARLHNGSGFENPACGKDGHCWWISVAVLEANCIVVNK